MPNSPGITLSTVENPVLTTLASHGDGDSTFQVIPNLDDTDP
jgi:hypothetical protein